MFFLMLVSPSQSAPGETIDAADINNPINQLASAINGNLDDDNINSVSGSKLVDGTVTNAKLSTTTGEPGAWHNWTPTFTNLSGGTLNYARYMRIGKTVHFRIKYSLTGANVGNAPKFSLPVSEASTYDQTGVTPIGMAHYRDAGTSVVTGTIVWESTGVAEFRYNAVSGSNVVYSPVTATVPFTWTNTDQIHAFGTYEAA